MKWRLLLKGIVTICPDQSLGQLQKFQTQERRDRISTRIRTRMSSSQQAKLTEYFSVRRRLDDQHPAKKRKIQIEAKAEVTQDHQKEKEAAPVTTEVVTSALTNQHLPAAAALSTPTKQDVQDDVDKNQRRHKRDSFGAQVRADEIEQTPKEEDKEDKKFTIGRVTPATARKRLDYGDAKRTTTRSRKKVAVFHKKGALSPSKDSLKQLRDKVASFRQPESPVKQEQQQEQLVKKEEAKLTLKKVNKLSDLKAQFEKRSDFKARSSSSQATPTKRDKTPKLSQDKEIPVEILSPKKTPGKSPAKALLQQSKAKASPRKKLDFGGAKTDALRQSDKDRVPMPRSYNSLLKAFQALDSIVAMQHNRSAVVTVQNMKVSLKRETGVNEAKNEKLMRQIK